MPRHFSLLLQSGDFLYGFDPLLQPSHKTDEGHISHKLSCLPGHQKCCVSRRASRSFCQLESHFLTGFAVWGFGLHKSLFGLSWVPDAPPGTCRGLFGFLTADAVTCSCYYRSHEVQGAR